MLIAAILIVAMPVELPVIADTVLTYDLAYAKKKRKADTSGAGRKFRSCEAARKAGYTHMRRGQAGYSKGLDRDGDGVACDKVK
jgi:hypothetical protein